MKKLFYLSYRHEISPHYEDEKVIYLIQAESREQAIALLYPYVVEHFTEEESLEYALTRGTGEVTFYEIDFSTSPVIHVENVYTGD
jgi:hypothetical protein